MEHRVRVREDTTMPHAFGEGDAEDGVTGTSTNGSGVVGRSSHNVGILGVSDGSQGVWGESTTSEHSGVVGHGVNGPGVTGETDSAKAGVIGRSKLGWGVRGESKAQGRSAVFGVASAGPGVTGEAHGGRMMGVKGWSVDAQGVWGMSDAAAPGVQGTSKLGMGVLGHASAPRQAGVVGRSDAGPGVVGESTTANEAAIVGIGRRLAGQFSGDVEIDGTVFVTQDVRLTGKDLAEHFEVIGAMPEPGTVVVLAGENSIRCSDGPYDPTVAGVVSGAGDCRPGLILSGETPTLGLTVALAGRVWVRADATAAPIRLGTLLTSSPLAGHAMAATDASRSVGATIGKALRPLDSGTGLIPMLVTLA